MPFAQRTANEHAQEKAELRKQRQDASRAPIRSATAPGPCSRGGDDERRPSRVAALDRELLLAPKITVRSC